MFNDNKNSSLCIAGPIKALRGPELPGGPWLKYQGATGTTIIQSPENVCKPFKITVILNVVWSSFKL